MIRLYIKQAMRSLRENRLTSLVSILGTTLSVAMILVVVLQFQIKLTGYSPVSERPRMLYVTSVHTSAKDGSVSNNTGFSAEVARECFYPLSNAEQVSLRVGSSHVISLPGKRLFDEYGVIYTDPAFWKLFDFRFLYGHPFDEADFQSGLPNVVITDYLASRLFGSTDVVGREMLMNNTFSCRVVGVVSRPTRAAFEVFADAWLPYSSNKSFLSPGWCDGICGPFAATILAPEQSAFPAIAREIQQNVARYNAGKADYTLSLLDPLTILDRALGNYGHYESPRRGWADYFRQTGLVLLFLLLVPALNLTGLVQSAVQRRRSEMGLRKAFGATGGRLFTQVVCENLVVTLIGGAAGILLAVGLLYFGRSYLLSADTEITWGMIFQPLLFVAALLLSLLLNLLGAALPAYRVSRGEIVDALKDENE